MTTNAPFGRLLTAMVTPFKKDGAIDWAGIEKLADHLVQSGHDGIVVNGTTGEAPTTKSSEKEEIIKVVRKTVGAKVKVLSGAGDNETEYSINQAKRTQQAGADGLLVVTPYYNKLKDAKGDVASTSWVIKRCGIPVYSGDDILNLPLLSVGAVGFVSVCGHTVGKDLREMLDSWFAGNSNRALEIHQKLLPVYTGTFRTQGAILTKAALNLMGLPGGHTRLPLVDATDAQIAQLRDDLRAGGVTVK
jgi:4-hydroxy-tetrahydrodipicolinate synthase